MATYEYKAGQELPDLPLEWRDGTGTLIDFTSAYTFTVTVALRGTTSSLFSKTSGITGAATSPNVTIAWATTSELNSLSAGTYDVEVRARHVSDSKDRWFPAPIDIVVKTPIA